MKRTTKVRIIGCIGVAGILLPVLFGEYSKEYKHFVGMVCGVLLGLLFFRWDNP